MKLPNARAALAVFLSLACTFGASIPASAQQSVSPLSPSLRESDQGTAAAPSTNLGGSKSSGFGSIFHDTVRDFGRFPSKDTAVLLGIGALAATFANPSDLTVSRGFSREKNLDEVFEPGTSIGGAQMQLAASLATFAAGRLSRSTKVTTLGADLIRAQIISQAITAGIKMTARRTRPDGTMYSFPSGHTATTFATATVLQRDLGWKVGLPAYALASYVAASRIQQNRHFLSDVAFGAAIGIATGRTVTIGRGDKKFAVAPMATPGGGGVSFTLVQPR